MHSPHVCGSTPRVRRQRSSKVEIFPYSKAWEVTPYPAGERAGADHDRRFVLNGSKFVGLNGGPDFTYNESISF